MKKTQGFTLIELLIVIAIIGVLSTVVIASVNIAREKAANTSIKQNLNSLRSQAEVYYDNSPIGYTDVCIDAQIVKIRDAADIVSGASTTCTSSANDWVVSSPFKSPDSSGNNYWCVDSTGVGRGHTDPLGVATACP